MTSYKVGRLPHPLLLDAMLLPCGRTFVLKHSPMQLVSRPIPAYSTLVLANFSAPMNLGTAVPQ